MACQISLFFLLCRCDPTQGMASFTRFLDHTQRRTTVFRTPLDEWSARRRDLYLTIHNTHNRQISMPPVGFEPTISPGERPQTYALDRAATGTGIMFIILCVNSVVFWMQWFWNFLYVIQKRKSQWPCDPHSITQPPLVCFIILAVDEPKRLSWPKRVRISLS